VTAGPRVLVAGGGLAGCEAAYQIARRGVAVDLWEMRPAVSTPAHRTEHLAELVCSNSLGSDGLSNASGLLKAELRQLDSLLIAAAGAAQVPAGKALAVDRLLFARQVAARLNAMPGVLVHRRELREIPEHGPTVIATGPLTSDALTQAITKVTGQANLSFFDAIAPIVTADSVDPQLSYWASRYDTGEADYLNCPMDQEQYGAFWAALIQGDKHPRRDFEHDRFFEGCLPVEEMARRGEHTLRFGPLKPVGLRDPRTGLRPFAVLQLRREDHAGQLLNLVGCQTNLTYAAQRHAFRLIPALREAEFVRYGMMHRNTYIRGPEVLTPSLEHKTHHGLFFAGQLTGVEGYTESIAMGLVAGANAARVALGLPPVVPPPTTVIGALANYVSSAPTPDFQPMNANWALLPPLPAKAHRRERPVLHAERSLLAIEAYAAAIAP
jgi:methylenetetrahydrofolate--tRNA-(uracil-5-)-methyltransferase